MLDVEVNVYFIVETGPDEAELDEAEADDAVVGATNDGVDNSIFTFGFTSAVCMFFSN